MNTLELPLINHLLTVTPEFLLAALTVVVLILDLRWTDDDRPKIAIVSGVGLGLIALVAALIAPGTATPAGPYWGEMIRFDFLTHIFKVMVIMAAGLTCLMSINVSGIGKKGEFYLILIVATLGMTLMAGSSDLIMAFLALETTSIPLYILAAFRRGDNRSVESGMKYFLFGSFASAIMLYGLSLLYGFTGHTNLYKIAEVLGSGAFINNPVPVIASMVLIVVGFGFKVSAVPFHFWTPDVYEGAPTPVTAFLSVASKAASFALMIRFFLAVFPASLIMGGQEIQSFWVNFMAASAVISMIVGNVVALAQKNIKRLLAYSSIAQAGYTLVGVAALQAVTPEGQTAAVASIAFYMFMYVFTNLLAFAVVIVFSEATGSETIADLGGLNRRNPWLALAMTIALLSLAGVPPAAGFFGKFFLFNAAVQAGLTWLAIVGVLAAIVSLYYYLVVIKTMYVDHGQYEEQTIPVSGPYAWVLGITVIAVILIGTVAAQPIYEWAARGAAGLFS